MSKLKILEQIPIILATKHKEKVIVHCHGCFDCLHIGHIRHLQAAKGTGDILVVTVTDDKNVGKGPGRPIFNESDRAEMLAALECVDYVAINRDSNAIKAIRRIKPDFYAKGSDYADTACDEFVTAAQEGGSVIFTQTPKFSTTEFIARVKQC